MTTRDEILAEMKQAEEFWPGELERIRHANPDLGALANEEGLSVLYTDSDYLYVTFGEPRPSLAISLSDLSFLTAGYDEKTYIIRCFDVSAFLERLDEVAEPKGRLWDLLAKYVREGKHEITWEPGHLPKDVAKALTTILPSVVRAA